MKQAERVSVPAGSESKSYYKYYLRDLAPYSFEKQLLQKMGAGNNANALDIADRAKLMDPGYLPDEIGYYLLDNGAACVSNNTFFKGSTGEMLQWWFAWHGLDPLRYAIWDPFDHYNTELDEASRAKILDPNTSIPDKCFDVEHLVTESLVLGDPGIPIAIHFKTPEEMGFDRTKLGTKEFSFFVGGNVEIITPEGQPNVPIVMIHTARDVEGGCELRSRFWMGYHIIDGQGVCLLPPGFKFPEVLVKQLLGHNFTEYTNLASILPDVYKENVGTW